MTKINDLVKYVVAGALFILPIDARNYSNEIDMEKYNKVFTENPKVVSKIEKKVIIFDPGHGMGNRVRGLYDPGAINKNIYEEVICWNQAKNLDSLTNKEKYKVLISRDRNKNSHLYSRRKVANDSLADALISLHINDSENKKFRGFEIIYGRHRDSRRLAELISEELGKIQGIKRRKIKKRTVENVLGSWKYPSVIIESGFIKNREDLKYLTDSVFDVEFAIKRGYERFFERDVIKKINVNKFEIVPLKNTINK